MSASTSRPRIRSVSCTALSASDVNVTEIVLTPRAMAAAVRQIDRSLAGRLEASCLVDEAMPLEMLSVVPSRRKQFSAEKRVLASTQGSVSPLDTLKLAALAGIGAAGFAADPRAIRVPLHTLAMADTAEGVERARTALLREAQASHLHVLSARVASVCADACKAVGFAQVEVTSDPLRAGLRVVATDAWGRALVSEIRMAGHHVGVETEVVGVSDGSCTGILDRLDAEIESRGVRADRSRTYTGGVCRLATARQVAERLSRPVKAVDTALRRRQRLNTRQAMQSRKS